MSRGKRWVVSSLELSCCREYNCSRSSRDVSVGVCMHCIWAHTQEDLLSQNEPLPFLDLAKHFSTVCTTNLPILEKDISEQKGLRAPASVSPLSALCQCPPTSHRSLSSLEFGVWNCPSDPCHIPQSPSCCAPGPVLTKRCTPEQGKVFIQS